MWIVFTRSTTQNTRLKDPKLALPIRSLLAAALKEEVPGVEKITRFNGGGVLASIGESQVRLQSAFVDPESFSIFTFPVKKGDQNPVTVDLKLHFLKRLQKLFSEQRKHWVS